MRAFQKRLRAQILEYLVRRPDAGDNLQGIIQWWLPVAAQGVTEAQVEHVLDDLVGEGFLQCFSTAGGRRHYRLSEQHGGKNGE